jgi:signal transduction histidine kinase
MSSSVIRKFEAGEPAVAQQPHGSLAAMMDRFTAASARLSERHESLSAEIESLRARLRVKDEELARAARLSTLGATAAALAHEVRNPLGSIKLFLSLLREDLGKSSSSAKIVESIERSVSNLDHVVSNMLQFAADKPCRLELCTPAAVMMEVAEQLRAEHPELEVELLGDRAIRAMFDESALRQIISNLWRNAGQAMRWRGKITTSLWMSNENWGFWVKDFGPGIPENLLPTLFEPFVTGRSEGTGLGLAIVRRLVEQHRGTISARNGTGDELRGAEFELRFLKGVL